MKLILLYGPPAVGKLTIAKIISETTGINNFHNHMVLDVINDIFGKENPERKELGYKIRGLIVEEAAKERIDLIVTGVALNHNKHLYEGMIEAYVKNGGQICLIKLTSPREVLLERVEDESRINKFNNKEDLEKFLDKYPEIMESLGDHTQLEIDTSEVTPEESAEKILSYFNL